MYSSYLPMFPYAPIDATPPTIILAPGIAGPEGPQGPKGETGPIGLTGFFSGTLAVNTVITQNNYVCSNTDCYIGVNSAEPVQITLPTKVDDGHILIVKAEYNNPPLRPKITIISGCSSLIDSSSSYIIKTPHGSVMLLYKFNRWNII